MSPKIMLARSERRQLARLPLELLAHIKVEGTKKVAFALTRNVSARGIYFYTRTLLHIGQELECTLLLPEKLTSAASASFVACQARVLRLNADLRGQGIGVAVEVHSLDFSRPGHLPAEAAFSFDLR
jgi:hypothetical protein